MGKKCLSPYNHSSKTFPEEYFKKNPTAIAIGGSPVTDPI